MWRAEDDEDFSMSLDKKKIEFDADVAAARKNFEEGRTNDAVDREERSEPEHYRRPPTQLQLIAQFAEVVNLAIESYPVAPSA
ncbi:MAG: hypothetical protein AUG51_14180 [Acidobacteria bacterium 13_1_20CM_3_53_8]|nr:MAG: hypothetical protein AUG51_14180 [Acidobacteria bacterium 13_1_20CM_3_53_8]